MMQKVRGAGLFVYVWVLFRKMNGKYPGKREKMRGR